jgi:hypothetical protein
LDLSTNRFTGPLPRTFNDLPALTVLRLMNNALTGTSRRGPTILFLFVFLNGEIFYSTFGR